MDNIETQASTGNLDPNTQGFMVSEAIEEFKFFSEATKDGSNEYFIEGIFLQADIKNKNNRIYPSAVMEKAVENYRPKIVAKEAYGELDHPSSQGIHLQNVCLRIDNLDRNGSNWHGKARVLEHTNCGKQLIGLFENGVKMGVSSRGFAKLVPDTKRGVIMVQDNFQLTTGADVVHGQSAPDANISLVTENDQILAEHLVYHGNLLSYDFISERWIEETRNAILSADSKKLETEVLPNLVGDYLKQL